MRYFHTLTAANLVRNQLWDPENKLNLSFKGNELAGEAGEACNVIKKLERERLLIPGSRDTLAHLGEELADLVICASLIANKAGLDLNDEIVKKFNATSDDQGFDVMLRPGRLLL